MNRQLSMEFVRITEQAALLAGRLMGTGDKEGADQAAVDGMHQQFAKTPVSGTVVIGEGEIDEAPMLYIGEKVGQGGEEVDIAVDPVEGTNLVAKGKDGAIAVLAIAPKGCLLHAPDMYMQKICVGPRAKGCIDINASVTENLTRVAKAMDREISDLTMLSLIVKDMKVSSAKPEKPAHASVSSPMGMTYRPSTAAFRAAVFILFWAPAVRRKESLPLSV